MKCKRWQLYGLLNVKASCMREAVGDEAVASNIGVPGEVVASAESPQRQTNYESGPAGDGLPGAIT